MTAEHYETALFPSENPGAPLVILNTVEGEGEEVCRQIREITKQDFSLAAVSGINWNEDMSPWYIPPVFKGDASYAGKADLYLKNLEEKIIPNILKELPGTPSYIAIAGYSLAGLFALYSLYRSDLFDRVASVSGSLWYPDFCTFAKENFMKKTPSKIYFSLGDKESRTRNPILKSVEENTKNLFEFYQEKNIQCLFEINLGNHFQDAEKRMAKGISWLLE